MSVRKLTASVLTILALLGGVTKANAQKHFNDLPPVDPFAFDPDFRWFEPVYNMDLADMKSKHRAPTGWFATYDRLNLYGSRPETDDQQASETKLDSGWGHRYEVGYMTPEDTGWTFTWTENAVLKGFYVRHEAANRFNDGQSDALGTDGTALIDPFFGFGTPPGEINNLGSDYRFYDVGNTQNEFKFDSYELNKTWRMEPYHYGGILEPLIGIRYMNINDNNRATRLRTDGDVTGVNGVIPGDFEGADQLLTDRSYTENDMLGGQIGFRLLQVPRTLYILIRFSSVLGRQLAVQSNQPRRTLGYLWRCRGGSRRRGLGYTARCHHSTI